MANEVFVLFVTILEILNLHDLDLDLWNAPKSNLNMQIERPMFPLSVTVCEIITYELLNILDSNFDFENEDEGR